MRLIKQVGRQRRGSDVADSRHEPQEGFDAEANISARQNKALSNSCDSTSMRFSAARRELWEEFDLERFWREPRSARGGKISIVLICLR
jgi:hypothetical protein